jgi:hypothetical protein
MLASFTSRSQALLAASCINTCLSTLAICAGTNRWAAGCGRWAHVSPAANKLGRNRALQN